MAEPKQEIQPIQQAAATPAPTPTPQPTLAPVEQNSQLIVLLYHRFEKPRNAKDLMAIEPAVFEEQMKELQDKGITVISMADFLAWKRGEKAIPAKSALITIDDGFKSAYEVGWPILKKFNYPFTMFIYTDFVKGERLAGGQSLTWEQLGEMRDAGVSIESHTVSHGDLRFLPKKGNIQQTYDEWLWNETAGSKKKLEDQLGIKISVLAFPYGNHNEKVRETSLKAGYEALFTTYGQKLTSGTAMESLGRYSIEPNKPEVFKSAVNFSGSSSGSGVMIAQVAAASMLTQPMEGETITDPKPVIKANLATMGQIDPVSVEMRLSGFGVVPAKYDPETKMVTCQMTQKLRDKNYTVILSAKSQGKKVETRWSFNFDPNAKASAAPAQKVDNVSVGVEKPN